ASTAPSWHPPAARAMAAMAQVSRATTAPRGAVAVAAPATEAAAAPATVVLPVTPVALMPVVAPAATGSAVRSRLLTAAPPGRTVRRSARTTRARSGA